MAYSFFGQEDRTSTSSTGYINEMWYLALGRQFLLVDERDDSGWRKWMLDQKRPPPVALRIAMRRQE